MPRKKEKTPYQKAIQNLKRRIKTAEKAGYIFPVDFKIPNSTKKVKELRGNKLYERATAYTSKYGEYYETPPTTKEKRRIEKEEREFYGDFRDSYEYQEEYHQEHIDTRVIDDIREKINIFEITDKGPQIWARNEEQKERLLWILDETISQDGIEAVADRLNNQSTSSEINEIVDEALNTYGKTEQQVSENFNAFVKLITGRALTPQQGIDNSTDYTY